LVFGEASATHLAGGEITWECHPTSGKYRFVAQLYRECGGNTVPLPSSVTLSGGPVNIVCVQTMIVDVSRNCGSPISGVSCANDTAAGLGAIKMRIYKSTWVTLNGVPPVTGWTFSWGSCCRLSYISNINTGSFSQRAIMYPYNNTNVSNCYDNSPKFLETPLFASCSGTPVSFNNNGFDIDGDSIYYEFAPSLESTGSIANYNTGYSFSSPFPSNSPPFNSNNKSVTLNGESGQINYTTYDNGGYTSTIKVEEWRCGVLIGEVFREYPTSVYPCISDSGSCVVSINQTPTLNLIVDSTSFPNGPWVKPVFDNNGNVNYYSTTVYAKDKIKFTIQSADND